MELQEQLRSFLLEKLSDAIPASGGREVVVRCRFCGDSQSDRNARHLYISLGSKDKPPMYNCFKCGEHGLLTKSVLETLVDTVDDGELVGNLNTALSKYSKMHKTHGKNTVFNIRIDYNNTDALDDAKLLYLNKRLGLNLTYSDLVMNKIVLNLRNLIIDNHITELTRDERSVMELAESFLGFLSMNNGYVTMKNLRPGKVSKYVDHKYVDYALFDSENNSRRFYSIPTTVNLIDPTPIKVHIAEGCFDILGIFYHVCNGNRYQNLYINCGDKAYNNVVKMLLKEYGLINCEFYLYPDNDVQTKDIYINTFGRPLHIIRNRYPGEKDFGVRKSRIKPMPEASYTRSGFNRTNRY